MCSLILPENVPSLYAFYEITILWPAQPIFGILFGLQGKYDSFRLNPLQCIYTK